MDTGEKCVLNQQTNNLQSEMSKHGMNAQLLASIMFTGCDKSGRHDPFYNAVVSGKFKKISLFVN